MLVGPPPSTNAAVISDRDEFFLVEEFAVPGASPALSGKFANDIGIAHIPYARGAVHEGARDQPSAGRPATAEECGSLCAQDRDALSGDRVPYASCAIHPGGQQPRAA